VAQAKRELFKAAEVCEVLQVQPYVLRSWEAEFPQIGQAPAGGGPRVYRRSDVQLVLRIKQLVFEEGLTLSGARRRLEEDPSDSNGAATALVEEVVGDRVRDGLKDLRSGLEAILQMLSKNGEEPRKSHRAIAAAPVDAAPKKKVASKAKSKK
jgi:DNA-binding transcriptional MerR regulator